MSWHTELFDLGSSHLYEHHGVRTATYKADLREVEVPWASIFVQKVELDAADADRPGRKAQADGERRYGDFLIGVDALPTDGAGRPVFPTEYTAVRFQGREYRASKHGDRPVWLFEDDEGGQIRFRTTDQGLF